MTDLAALDTKMDIVMDRLVRIETLIQTETERCPHREAIARASNNGERLSSAETHIESLQAAVHSVQLRLASWGALSGSIGGVLTVVASKLLNIT